MGEQTPNMVYTTYVLRTCKHMSYQQRINCYTTAYAVVKILLYGDLRINKYSYSYFYSYHEQNIMPYYSVLQIRIHFIRIHKGRPSYRRNLQQSKGKENTQHFKLKFPIFFLWVIFAFAFTNPLYLAQNNNHLVEKID